MFNNGENEENLENNLYDKSLEIQNKIDEKCNEYKNIIKIILLCFCLIIIIIPSPKKNLDNPTHQTTLPEQKREPTIKKDQEQKDEPKHKNEPEHKGENEHKDEPEHKEEKENKDEKINEGTDINKYNNENKENSTFVNLYIVTHKEFKNDAIFNPSYKILVDDISILKKEYKLEIIPTNNTDNVLYPKRIGYSECSKIYPIWKLYKAGNITSKYVGFFHYRRIFEFTNNIPDLDTIFQKFDAILMKRFIFKGTIYEQFMNCHIPHFLDESVEIIKEKFPEYAPYCDKYLKKTWGNFCNIFIMKKDDFIKWGEFLYGVLLELDRRYNLTTDEDIKNLMREEIKHNNKIGMNQLDYQSRLEAFLSERISGIFYEKHFQKIYEIPVINVGY